MPLSPVAPWPMGHHLNHKSPVQDDEPCPEAFSARFRSPAQGKRLLACANGASTMTGYWATLILERPAAADRNLKAARAI